MSPRRRYALYCSQHISREDYELFGRIASSARGEKLPSAKLDAEKVQAIRENRHRLTDKQWAAKLGVHKNTIYNARHGIKWGHV